MVTRVNAKNVTRTARKAAKSVQKNVTDAVVGTSVTAWVWGEWASKLRPAGS